jgi:hypothetical protein
MVITMGEKGHGKGQGIAVEQRGGKCAMVMERTSVSW